MRPNRLFSPYPALLVALSLLASCSGEGEPENPDASVVDGSTTFDAGSIAPCACPLELPEYTCPRRDDTSAPACFRAYGAETEQKLLGIADCKDRCGHPDADVVRCVAPLHQEDQECFAKRSEAVIACMESGIRTYGECQAETSSTMPCTETEEKFAACRALAPDAG